MIEVQWTNPGQLQEAIQACKRAFEGQRILELEPNENLETVTIKPTCAELANNHLWISFAKILEADNPQRREAVFVVNQPADAISFWEEIQRGDLDIDQLHSNQVKWVFNYIENQATLSVLNRVEEQSLPTLETPDYTSTINAVAQELTSFQEQYDQLAELCRSSAKHKSLLRKKNFELSEYERKLLHRILSSRENIRVLDMSSKGYAINADFRLTHSGIAKARNMGLLIAYQRLMKTKRLRSGWIDMLDTDTFPDAAHYQELHQLADTNYSCIVRPLESAVVNIPRELIQQRSLEEQLAALGLFFFTGLIFREKYFGRTGLITYLGGPQLAFRPCLIEKKAYPNRLNNEDWSFNSKIINQVPRDGIYQSLTPLLTADRDGYTDGQGRSKLDAEMSRLDLFRTWADLKRTYGKLLSRPIDEQDSPDPEIIVKYWRKEQRRKKTLLEDTRIILEYLNQNRTLARLSDADLATNLSEAKLPLRFIRLPQYKDFFSNNIGVVRILMNLLEEERKHGSSQIVNAALDRLVRSLPEIYQTEKTIPPQNRSEVPPEEMHRMIHMARAKYERNRRK